MTPTTTTAAAEQNRALDYADLQICLKGEGSAVWNHPIDVHFGTDSLSGWPRVLVEVWSVDGCDRSELAGYGMIFVPTSPGTYDLDCVTWRPQGTLGDQLSAALLGAPPNLVEVTTAASGADRFELRTETAGTVVFHLEVLVAGFADRNQSPFF
ncbi:conserved unknown protein [Ectocarpus siliculosus]|uniref:B9 domain-containing protein 2 n=1 Tax=Ectocarpus siliculosus TaxID=2880 RepID=D7FXF4_ECTSI|nr:conserved unknown protein [Ectocarpus siliculosus]|eukprot:CBJ32291.1 conserved unknown protein [Ectocarpus siliculosus]